MMYATSLFLRFTLTHGPLSVLWSALNLGFIPAVIYAGCFLHEPITLWHGAALVMAIACVLTSASLQKAATGPGAVRPASRLRYGLALTGLLLANSGGYIGMKALAAPRADGKSLLDLHFAAYLATLYGGGLACLLLDHVVTRARFANVGVLLRLVAAAACVSMAGMWLLSLCAGLPAAVVFMVNTMSSLLFTALCATLFFGEQRCRRWYAAQALAMLAVICAQGDALLRLLRACWP